MGASLWFQSSSRLTTFNCKTIRMTMCMVDYKDLEPHLRGLWHDIFAAIGRNNFV